MKFIYYPFWLIYRLWFYALVFICTLLLSPLLIISISKRSWYPIFFRIARVWANFILIGMGFYKTIHWEESLKRGQSYIFVANHTSMLDIMLMFSIIRYHPFVFVGKKELAKIPLFGYFYKRTSILVDRSNAISRKKVFSYAQDRIKQGLSICIFPEGGVPPEHIRLDDFKIGAFKLSLEHKLPLVPFTFLDNKRRFSYTFFSGTPGRMRVKAHSFFSPKDYKADSLREMKEKAYNLILKSLEKDSI
jgi:1-acyl-sn-glycerol-3-phosphate acyltransferase